MKFTVLDVPQLPYKTRIPGLVFDSPGNVYNSANYADLTDEDLARWHKAGFIHLEGLPDLVPDSQRRVTVTPDDIEQIVGLEKANG